MTYYTGTVDPRDFTSVLRGENGGARVILSLMTIMISAACCHNMHAGRTGKKARVEKVINYSTLLAVTEWNIHAHRQWMTLTSVHETRPLVRKVETPLRAAELPCMNRPYCVTSHAKHRFLVAKGVMK